MRRTRMRIGIAMAMAILIAVVLLAVSSARSGLATAGTLSSSDMGKILGMCGCHHKMYGDCDATGTPCVECGGGCGTFTASGSQAQTCEFKEPENDFVCKESSGDPTICKTNYVCSSEKKGGLKCGVENKCVSAMFSSCNKCTVESQTDVTLPNHYCGTAS